MPPEPSVPSTTYRPIVEPAGAWENSRMLVMWSSARSEVRVASSTSIDSEIVSGGDWPMACRG